jgi:hypothetical protein
MTTARRVEPSPAPPIVRRVVAGPGRPLDARTRRTAAARLGHDFETVRVHADPLAAASARAIDAEAYTVADHVVFAAGRYAPGSRSGAALLLHELTHVVQQRGSAQRAGPLAIRPADAAGEQEATAVARNGSAAGLAAGTAPVAVQRQPPPAATGARICSRPLQGVGGFFANHAYVESGDKRYAIIHPFCPGPDDDVVNGTTARKWDNSPDPCGQTPTCVECRPAAGVTDVAACLQAQYDAYNSPNLYRMLGPNSNTFAGTLARACCADVGAIHDAIGNCPGWGDAAAPARAPGAECLPGPTCG